MARDVRPDIFSDVHGMPHPKTFSFGWFSVPEILSKGPEFYTPLALNCQKGHHLPAPEVYKNQSPIKVLQKQFHQEIIFVVLLPPVCPSLQREHAKDSAQTEICLSRLFLTKATFDCCHMF